MRLQTLYSQLRSNLPAFVGPLKEIVSPVPVATAAIRNTDKLSRCRALSKLQSGHTQQFGGLLLIEGRLRQDFWTTEDGSRRSAVEIVADQIQFLGRGQASGPADGDGDFDDENIPCGKARHTQQAHRASGSK
jgi:single-stranded DNA-binding protein